MLSQLVYVSQRKSICTDEEITKILKSCERNNSNISITGVLLYSDTNFAQCIEGEYKEIIALYDKIKNDPRHQNAILICSAPIEQRAFPSWQMGSKRIDTASIEFKTQINKSDRQLFTTMLNGKKQEGNKALELMKKFFK